jgi:hypothetical protein
MQQHVDVADALGLEPTAAVSPPMLGKVGVEAIEMRGCQRLQRNMAQRRDDLGFGIDAVGRPGGRSDSGPGGRQPVLGEEGTQRQPRWLYEDPSPQGSLGLVERGLRLSLGREPALAQLTPPTGCRVQDPEVPGPRGPALASTAPSSMLLWRHAKHRQ